MFVKNYCNADIILLITSEFIYVCKILQFINNLYKIIYFCKYNKKQVSSFNSVIPVCLTFPLNTFAVTVIAIIILIIAIKYFNL